MPKTTLTDKQWLDYLKNLDIPDLNEWMIQQAERGQDYYDTRLKMIGFNGGHVLDAGCGVGNWTNVLARYFDQVTALEFDEVRLGVVEGLVPHLGPHVTTKLGNVEDLPFPDESFDSVFCNGVVFLTNLEKTLSEMFRVLKPGGSFYVTYNGKNWWRHLISDRAPTEPVCFFYGANGRISYYFRLIEEFSSEHCIPDTLIAALYNDDMFRIAKDFWSAKYTTEQRHSAWIKRFLSAERQHRSRLDNHALNVLSQWLLQYKQTDKRAREALQALEDITDPVLENEVQKLQLPQAVETYSHRIARDFVKRAFTGIGDPDVTIQTHSYETEEFEEVLAKCGFSDMQSAHEGHLNIDEITSPVPGIYEKSQGVFETIARKPL